MKIVKFFKRVFLDILGFFGLLDDQRQLSRTTTILYIFVYKFAMVPIATSSINELVGAIVALGGVGGAMGLYAWKKNIAAKAGSVGESLIEAIKTNETKTETEE